MMSCNHDQLKLQPGQGKLQPGQLDAKIDPTLNIDSKASASSSASLWCLEGVHELPQSNSDCSSIHFRCFLAFVNLHVSQADYYDLLPGDWYVNGDL